MDLPDPATVPVGTEITRRAEPRPIDSEALLGREGEALIRHEGRLYRLRRTRSGKLILTA